MPLWRRTRAAAAKTGYAPILSVREIVGDLAFDEEMRFKLRAAADNRIKVLARNRAGMMLIVC